MFIHCGAEDGKKMTKEELCEKLKEFIEDEKKAWSEYFDLMGFIMQELPETRTSEFNVSFVAATADDEKKHRELLEALYRMAKCEG